MTEQDGPNPIVETVRGYRTVLQVVLASLLVIGGWVGLMILLAAALPAWMAGKRAYHLGDSAWSAALLLSFLTILLCIGVRAPARRWRIFHLIAAVPALATGAVTGTLAYFVPPSSPRADFITLTAATTAAGIYVIAELRAWWRRGRTASIPSARIRPRQ